MQITAIKMVWPCQPDGSGKTTGTQSPITMEKGEVLQVLGGEML